MPPSLFFGETGEDSHRGHFTGLLPSSNPQLVDGRLGDLRPLLSLLQLVLNLPEAERAAAHLLLLADTHGTAAATLHPYYYYIYYYPYYALSARNLVRRTETHRLLRLPFEALDFGLKFVDQFLHPKQSLAIFFRLRREIQQRGRTRGPPRRRVPTEGGRTCAVSSLHLLS